MLPPFWDYRREYDELRGEILAAVDRVFKSGQLILGPEGVAFERDMAAYVGVAGGVGVNSGADGIYFALARHSYARRGQWNRHPAVNSSPSPTLRFGGCRRSRFPVRGRSSLMFEP